MKRVKTIILGITCLILAYGFQAYIEATPANDHDALEALLDDRDLDQIESDEELVALVSAIASHAAVDEEAQARIAQLEQMLADREAIILQLSDGYSREGVEALQQKNAELAEALEEALAQRDQIREDFNRLFEGGEFAQPAVDFAEASVEDEALRDRVQHLNVRLTAITEQLEAVLEERDALATRVTAFETELEMEREQRKAELQAQKDMFAGQLQAASDEKQALTVALEESEHARIAAEAAVEAEPLDEESLLHELASLRALDASRRVTMDEMMLQAGDLREKLNKIESENAQLRADFENVNEERQNYVAMVAERNTHIEELRQERDDKKKLLSGTWEKINSQAAEMGELRGLLGQRDAELAGNRELYVALENEYREAQAELVGARTNIDQLKSDIVSLREEKEKRVVSLQEIQQELERTLLVDEQRRRVLDETLEKLATVESREESLLKDQEAYRGQIKSLEGDRDTLRVELEDLASQTVDLKARLDEASASSDDLRASLIRCEQELVEKTASIAALEERVEALSADAAAARAQHSEVQQDLLETRKTLSEKEQALETTLSELENVRLVDDRRRRTLDETLTSLALAEQRQAELEALVAASDEQRNMAIAESQAEIEKLRARNRLLESEITRIEDDLRMAEAHVTAVATEDTDALDHRIASLHAQKTELQEALRLAQETVDDSAAKEKWESQLREQEERANAATAEVESLVAQLSEAEDMLRQLTAEPDAAETKALGLLEELQNVRLELERAQDALKEKQEALQLAQQDQVQESVMDIRETDLYLELEADLALIRDRLVETESERQRLRSDLEQLQVEMQNQQAEILALQSSKEASVADLALAKEREGEYQELLDRIVPEMRSLEDTVTELRREREQVASRLLQREDEIEALHVELEQREHRLARAERVAEVLERTRSEVEQAQRKQRLNMHYNMAAVYARDGRYTEAEYEYLQALRLDPSDADIHFNLGILYDDELGQPEKAILHYRRYLQLNPHGVDADRVRSWLMRLEMDQRR